MSARVVLGVGAGIAAYKACELLAAAHRDPAIGCAWCPPRTRCGSWAPPTWAALSGQPVTASVCDDVHEVPHVRLGQEADLVFVAPATADLLARAAAGRADDLLTSILLDGALPGGLRARPCTPRCGSTRPPRPTCAACASRGCLVLEPASGRLTGADTRSRPPAGAGRALSGRRAGCSPGRRRAGAADLAGRRVVISAGGTREELDPVRFLGNWSSGTAGLRARRPAAARGAEVTVVSANVDLADPAGTKVDRVISACQLRVGGAGRRGGRGRRGHGRGRRRLPARGQQRGEDQEGRRRRRSRCGWSRTPTSCASWPQRRPGQVIVGFAAETEDILAERAGRSSPPKDATCSWSTGSGAGSRSAPATTRRWCSRADGSATPVPRGPKEVLADVVWDLVAARLASAVAWDHGPGSARSVAIGPR